jgi:AraC-like DNA-binding protein
MTITISQRDYWQLVCETQDNDSTHPVEPFETVWRYPERLGQGYIREIELRQGLELSISRYRLHDNLTIQCHERSHAIDYDFSLTGSRCSGAYSLRAGEHIVSGKGITPTRKLEHLAAEPMLEVCVYLDPAVFQAYLGKSFDLASIGLDHLIRPKHQLHYKRSGMTTIAMQATLHQILQCPFQGILKKMYLESKVWELMALLLEQEQALGQGKCTPSTLKPDDVDRIHHARDILLQQLDRPPSLLELARLVGLNECTLKRGFREVFGTTAFGYLHDYRLEQARQLLQERRLNVSEVARAVGFGSCTYLARVFRKKYGISPKQYQTQRMF